MMTSTWPSARVASSSAVVAVVLSCSLGALTACGSDDNASTSTSVDTVGDVITPMVVDLGSIDGMTVEVMVGGTIDLTGDDSTYTDWTASIADPAVAEFTPGSDDGSASFNPGIVGLAPGTSEVTMTNSASDATVTFTVDVTS